MYRELLSLHVRLFFAACRAEKVFVYREHAHNCQDL